MRDEIGPVAAFKPVIVGQAPAQDPLRQDPARHHAEDRRRRAPGRCRPPSTTRPSSTRSATRCGPRHGGRGQGDGIANTGSPRLQRRQRAWRWRVPPHGARPGRASSCRRRPATPRRKRNFLPRSDVFSPRTMNQRGVRPCAQSCCGHSASRSRSSSCSISSTCFEHSRHPSAAEPGRTPHVLLDCEKHEAGR